MSLQCWELQPLSELLPHTIPMFSPASGLLFAHPAPVAAVGQPRLKGVLHLPHLGTRGPPCTGQGV